MQIRFTPHKLLGALFSFGCTAFVLGCLCFFIPEEETPRIEALNDGTTVYYLRSMRASVLPSVGIFTVVSTCCLYGWLFERREMRPPIPTASLFLKWCLWLFVIPLRTLLLLALALVLAFGIFVLPATQVRKIVVEPEFATFHAVGRFWTLPKDSVVDLDISRIVERRAHVDRVVLRLEIETTASPCCIEDGAYLPDNPELKERIKFLERIRADLVKR